MSLRKAAVQLPVILGLHFVCMGFGAGFENVRIQAGHVAGIVYMLQGAGGNIGVSAGTDGIFLIDAQFAPLADKIERAVERIKPGPIKFLLNTHWHQDHTDGNQVFGWKVPILSHENVRARLRSRQTRGKKIFEPAPEQSWPILTYQDSIKLYFNSEEIRIRHFPVGHTDGDSIVFFSSSNVIHMGDHFFNGKFPFVDLDSGGSLDGYTNNVLSVIESAKSNVKIIPGHGPLATLGDLKLFYQMLLETTGLVKQRLAKGMRDQEILKAGLPEKWNSWGTGFISTSKWLETITGSLRSTAHH
mgnify:CR=1 FL=1